MLLHDSFKQTDYHHVHPDLFDVLKELTLLDFTRKRDGAYQIFSFSFLYKQKEYRMDHHFLYGGNSVRHWFRFTPYTRLFPWISQNPFGLSHKELIKLSDELMKAVNAWTHHQAEGHSFS